MASADFGGGGDGHGHGDRPPPFAGWMQKPVAAPLPRLNAHEHTWSAINAQIATTRGAVLEHTLHQTWPIDEDTVAVSSAYHSTAHVHGDFATHPVPDGYGGASMEKHNIATSALGQRPLRHDALIGPERTAAQTAATAMRVLKGTAHRKPVDGSDADIRRAATLGAEIGVSEYGRGGGAAVLNAMSALYQVKRGRASGADFVDPRKGFAGSGAGGADRLRDMAEVVTPANPKPGMHVEQLRAIYETHAVKKPGKNWGEKGFDAWLEHKAKKWTQKV